MSNPIAVKLNEASVVMEGTPNPELVAMLRIGAEEIYRLQGIRDRTLDALWRNRRFYFKTLNSPPNTPLAVIFNNLLDVLGQTHTEEERLRAGYYPDCDKSLI